MAKVYVSQYADFRGGAPYGGPIQTDTASSTGSSAAVATVAANCNFIRVHTDGIISLNIGAAASVNTPRMAANTTEYFSVSEGQVVNVITNT